MSEELKPCPFCEHVTTELQIMRQDIAWIKDFLIKQTIGALPYATREEIAQKAREGIMIGGGL